jgi:integrase
MDTTTTTQPAKRGRNGSVILTDRMCEKRVTERVKLYDKKCPGLFASLTVAGITTLSAKLTDRNTGKQRTVWLGIHSPAFGVEDARSKVYSLRGMGSGALAETFRDRKAQQAKRGKTVDAIIEERIDWMQTPVRKPDGEMRPRIESWEDVASHLRRFLNPRLGKKIASEVTKHDIATLSNDIVAGRLGVPSVANARHMRRAASGLFNWAAEAGRDYVSASPCVNLPKLDDEHPKTRVLSEDEIRVLWHGLDREDIPWDRRTRLALKFALVTMLRSGELLPIHRDELNAANGTVDIPARRVKRRRVIHQPLSDLALQILNEAMGNYAFAFAGRFGDAPLSRSSMHNALRGNSKTNGICELLGLAPLTPHDLRRTAATMCGEFGLPESGIALCLDHQANKDENGKPLPAITNRVYNLGTRNRVARKRTVLDAWAIELRRIIGAETGLRLAA